MNRTRRVLLRLTAVVAVVLGVTALSVATSEASASAANGNDFRDGYIISDQNFFDSQSMDAPTVQSFLNSKVTRCVGANGLPCLRDYSTNVTAIAGDAYCSGMPAGAMSAAQIIVAAARACGISPKVLLVMLQKEQGLITDRSPVTWSYQAALGQGCPDYAPCDSAFSGFYRQVYFGARQMRLYIARPGSYGYQLGWNNILYHPDLKRGCGTKRVYIENNATRALYIYTPYTPNAAALSNINGSGDNCSSYGNRNFWRDYNDWFGPSTGGAGELAIFTKYNALGGASSWLGSAATPIVCGIKSGGCWQLFSAGLIVYSPDTGAQEMQARMHQSWVGQGYENGWMGYPTTPTVCGIKDGGCWQLFQGGVIMYSPATGTQPMRSVVHAAWVGQGYENGWMGYPTTPTNCVARDGGCWQLFQDGLVMYSPATGAQPMRSVVHRAWVAQGYENGWMGYPTSASQPTSAGGYTQTFQGGSLTVDAAGVPTYAGTVTTAPSAEIANRALGAGWLGTAGTPVVCGSINGGCWQAYQNGVIIYSPTSGAHSVPAPMHRAWVTQGYEAGWLGYPTAEAQQAPGGGYTQTFQGGSISVDGSGSPTFQGTGTTDANAAIANRLTSATWLGAAGTPIVCGSVNGGCWQAFQNGVIMYSPITGAHAVPSDVHRAWVTQGYEYGWLGYPTADAQQQPGGGYSQEFQGGTIKVDASGSATFARR